MFLNGIFDGGEEDILVTYGMMDSDGLFEEWTNKVTLVGYKVNNPPIYTCELCDKPILVYGRMLPCKHVFCYTCADQTIANTGLKCIRKGCGAAVTKMERAQAGTVYVCTFGTPKHDHQGCRRTYLSERDLQAHMDHRHIKAGKKQTKSKKPVKKDDIIPNPNDPRFKVQQDYLHHKNVPQVPRPDSISTNLPPPNVSSSGPPSNQPQIVAGFAVQPSRSANLITIPIQEERKMNPFSLPPPVLTGVPPRGMDVRNMPPISMSMPPPTMHGHGGLNAMTLTGTVLVRAPQQNFQSPPPNVLPPGIIPPNQRPHGPPPQLPQQPRVGPPVIGHMQPGQIQFPGPWMGQPGQVQVVQVSGGLRLPPHMQGMPGQPMPRQQHPGQPMPGQQHPGQPMPGQPMPGQQRPGQPMPGQPMPGQPMPGQQHPGQQPHPGGPQHPGQQHPGQQQQRPGQQPPHPGQQPPHPGQQPPHPGQQPPHPGQQPQHPGQQPQHPGQQPPHPGQQPPRPGQQPPHPGQQPPHPGQQPPRPGQQPPHPGQQPPHPGQQPQHPGQPPRLPPTSVPMPNTSVPPPHIRPAGPPPPFFR